MALMCCVDWTLHVNPCSVLQTGEVVAIKKIHLQEAKEVC